MILNAYDTILINELEFNCILGMLPFERTTPQRVIFNVELYTDFSKVSQTDNVKDTINYALAVQIIKEVAIGLKANMVEYLAENIIEALRTNFKDSLKGISLEILKPQIMPETKSVGIRVSRIFSE